MYDILERIVYHIYLFPDDSFCTLVRKVVSAVRITL